MGGPADRTGKERFAFHDSPHSVELERVGHCWRTLRAPDADADSRRGGVLLRNVGSGGVGPGRCRIVGSGYTLDIVQICGAFFRNGSADGATSYQGFVVTLLVHFSSSDKHGLP